MISDFVKGRRKLDYPEAVQRGITLHRAIDEFTDRHEASREAKRVFRPAYRLYAGAIVDVIYDHFLAADEQEFTESSLHGFSGGVYQTLHQHLDLLPERFARMYPYMKEQNWLFHYRSRWGTEKSLGGLVRRSRYLTESDTAFRLFEEHYQLLGDCYRHFWAEIKPFAAAYLAGLTDPEKKP